MKTAFINNPEEPVASIPWQVAPRVYLTGGSADLVALNPVITTGQIVGSPSLSPDKNEVVWSQGWTIAGAITNSIMRANVDGSDQQTLVSWTGAFQSEDAHPAWHPDGSKVVYFKQAAGGVPVEVRSIDRDGANDTLLHTYGAANEGQTACTYSPSGDYIMFTRSVTGSGEIWTMLADGSSPAAIRTSPYLLAFSLINTPAWKRGSDVLGFTRYESEATPILVQTINADGTGLTTIHTDNSRIIWGTTQHAWLSDDSALLSRKRLDGTNIFSGTKGRIVTVDAAGGGVTELIGSAHDIGWNNRTHAVIALDGGFEDGWSVTGIGPRVYFCPTNHPTQPGIGLSVSSVLEDGSDYRVDYTFADAAHGASGAWRGFEWTAA